MVMETGAGIIDSSTTPDGERREAFMRRAGRHIPLVVETTERGSSSNGDWHRSGMRIA